MKKLAATLMLVFGIATANAQAWSGKGDQKVNLGLSAWGNGTGITGSYDYGLGSLVSIGAGANVYFDGYKNDNADNKAFIFGRVNFHLQEVLDMPEKFDLYPGLNVGVLGKDFGLGAHLGVRYFFNNKIGIFGEIGNNGSLGVTFNL